MNKFINIINNKNDIIDLIYSDQEMMNILKIVKDLELNDWRIGAGFIRNKVRNYMHGYENDLTTNDIDIVHFKEKDLPVDDEIYYEIEQIKDKMLENSLKQKEPKYDWSVSNQARMHKIHGLNSFSSSLNAISNRVETATCVAIKLDDNNNIIFEAMHGIDDLINGIVRPIPLFLTSQDLVNKYKTRLLTKCWRQRWPLLKFVNID